MMRPRMMPTRTPRYECLDGDEWVPCRIVEMPGTRVNAWGGVSLSAGWVRVNGNRKRVGPYQVRRAQ